ncbi:Modulator of FtsH protease HflK [Buchnera aphidicola (Anoecia corni)]|uniref:Modulator of FtsH protease HflK, partial n=1 Tax=Buchnera aphidicola (Anoecia corni) TaxID=2994477 RepID=A0AAT9IGQ7_9GAMM
MSDKKKSNKIQRDVWGYKKPKVNAVLKDNKSSKIKNKYNKENDVLNFNDSSCKNKKRKNFFTKLKKIFKYFAFIFLFFWMLTGLYLFHCSSQKTLNFFWRISNFIQPGFDWNKRFTGLLDLTECKNVKSKIISIKLPTNNDCKVQVKIEFCYKIFNPTQYFFLVKEEKIDMYLDEALLNCSKKIIEQCSTDDILSSKIIDIQEKIFNEMCKQKILNSIGVHGKEIKIHSIKLVKDYVKELNVL